MRCDKTFLSNYYTIFFYKKLRISSCLFIFLADILDILEGKSKSLGIFGKFFMFIFFNVSS